MHSLCKTDCVSGLFEGPSCIEILRERLSIFLLGSVFTLVLYLRTLYARSGESVMAKNAISPKSETSIPMANLHLRHQYIHPGEQKT